MKIIPVKEAMELFSRGIYLPELEDHCREMEQVPCPVLHEFADGIYSRITTMPKGTFAIGKRHRYRTYNILLEGEIAVYTGPKEPIKMLRAPCTFVSDALVKKVAYFYMDTTWVNIHPTKETNLDAIENQFIIPDSEFALDGKPGDALKLSKLQEKI